MKVVLICLFAGLYLFAQGQEKIEREQRISEDKIPAIATEWLYDAFEEVDRVKWYFEETSGRESYEAKLRWKDHRFSIEFTTEGQLEDIEMEMEWKELPTLIQQNLEAYFLENYTKYKIRRIQQQWTGEPDDLEDAIDEDEMEDITTRYEIEFFGRSEEGKALWEGLFDEAGQLLNKRETILRPADNLNY